MDRKWWTLIVVCVATFMLLLDITIVNVALPEIERSLKADFADLQWVIDAYALTLAALLLTGGAFMFATSLALLASAFQGRDRGTAFGAWGATTGASVAVGPLVGGVLTDSVGWESIFLINVPIGIGAIAVTLARVAESRDPDAAGVDWAGLVTFSLGLFLLVFALVRGNAEGWGSALIVSFLAGAV